MEAHLISRPKKTPFPKKTQIALRKKAEEALKDLLLPDRQIEKIILIGSSIKGTFGQYQAPGFRGSIYSDFDFIVFVEDDYKIPDFLTKEPDGKPFTDDKLNLAFRESRFIENKYDLEIFFIRKSALNKLQTIKDGEHAGIPMTEDSRHPNLVIYNQNS